MRIFTISFFFLIFSSIFFFVNSTIAQSTIKWEDIWDFTDTTGDAPPGWQRINNDSSTTAPETGFAHWYWTQEIVNSQGQAEVTPQAGIWFAVSTFRHANAQGLIDEWLIGPKIQGIKQGDSLHFYAGANDGSFKDSLRVFISTTDSSLASFTNQIAYFKVDGPKGTWHKYSFDLSSFAGSDIFFGVNYYIVNCGPNGAHASQPYIDHFSVTTLMATSVEETPAIAEGFKLDQNYPNPFNPSTTINYSVNQAGVVELKIFDLLGKKIRTLVNENTPPGEYSVVWNGRDDFGKQAASGHYFYKIKAGRFQSTKKMLLLK